jgi:MFS transporter, PAT family, beta-lactamase induction signal transducer AmpG
VGASRRVRFWRFALASAPYGSFNGLVAVGLPYILRQRGITVERIAIVEALVQAPSIWFFLWGPVVDLALRRRTWIVVLSVASALCAAAALGNSTATVRSLTALLVLASVFSQPVSSALGGLVAAVVPNEHRGRTAGWSQAGIFVGGVVTGASTVWLSGHASGKIVALVAATLIAVPSLVALTIDEPKPEIASWSRHFAGMLCDVRATLARRDVWLGLVFFLSPIGAGALTYLFSGLASDFRASTAVIVWTVVLGGALTPVGALIGGMICDRFDRWLIYPTAGLFAALSAGVMAFAALSPATFLVGAAAYALSVGFCYAAFMALAFQLVGPSSPASGTRFTLFMAAVNVPVVYMLRLDGWGHARFGVRGMLAVDAISNGAFAVLFLAVLYITNVHARAAGRTDSESAPTSRSMSSTL